MTMSLRAFALLSVPFIALGLSPAKSLGGVIYDNSANQTGYF
jgi:hypothetical protein